MEFKRTSLSRFVTSVLPLSLLAVGCLAPLEFGEPVAPTDEQAATVELLSEAAGLVTSAIEGSATERKAFAMHALMAEIQTFAVLEPSPIYATGEVPQLHPFCVSGAPTVGYRYDNCRVGEDGLGSVHGEVLVDEQVDYDLHMSWGSDAANQANLLGSFERIDDRLYGELEMRIMIEQPGLGPIMGFDPGEGVGHVNTTSVWAVHYDETVGCISDGYVEIEVEARGEYHATRYTFDGCNGVRRVRNATR